MKAGKVGDIVPVQYGKASLQGKIAGVGKSYSSIYYSVFGCLIMTVGNKKEIILLEKAFINGSFTPFGNEEEPNILPGKCYV